MSRLIRNWCRLDLVLGTGSFHGPGGLAVKDALSVGRGYLVGSVLLDYLRSLRRQEGLFHGRFLFNFLLNVEAKLVQERGTLFEQELFTGRHVSIGFVALVDADDLVDLDQMLASVVAQVIILLVIRKRTQGFLALSGHTLRTGLKVAHKLDVLF